MMAKIECGLAQEEVPFGMKLGTRKDFYEKLRIIIDK